MRTPVVVFLALVRLEYFSETDLGTTRGGGGPSDQKLSDARSDSRLLNAGEVELCFSLELFHSLFDFNAVENALFGEQLEQSFDHEHIVVGQFFDGHCDAASLRVFLHWASGHFNFAFPSL